ncbi:MAG: phosphoribosylformylglycinamidine cyclo-ligase [Verrucomicrobia bacterium]|nr:phosphoribosylformylglycinamidine cyclo-ligase [Verrucomicrobiota bacterium]
MTKRKSAYAAAGVDIDEMMTGLAAAKRLIKRTATAGVVGDVGSFGGLHKSPGRDALIVASMDGVGTKLKVAAMAGRHDTVGQDLVNHCVNDILVQGATPLFFMDYLGAAKLRGAVFHDVIKGLSKACRENGCALLGGETAEMPGLYPSGEYDLVGTIVGSVNRKALITGEQIRVGDCMIGLRSSGLHTNGYSLARKALFEQAGLGLRDWVPGTRRRLGDALLAIHKSYLKPVSAVMAEVKIRGMAHITGGGLLDNVPRILPDGTAAHVDLQSWSVPPLFRCIQSAGRVEPDEMYRVFNMGIGYVVIVRQPDVSRVMERLRALRAGAVVIGSIKRGHRNVVLKS